MMDRKPRANWYWVVIATLLAGLLWQTLRIEGVQIGPVKLLGKPFYLVDWPGLKPRLATCEGNLAAIERAQSAAEALQNAVNLSEERRTAANAERSDIAHAQDLPRALAAGSDYALRHRIATGGLRAESDRGAASQSPAPAESGSASLHESLPADPFVAVSAADVQACTAAVTWAVGAYNWAQTLPADQTGWAEIPTPSKVPR